MSLLLAGLASSQDPNKRNSLLNKRANTRSAFQKSTTTTTEASYDVRLWFVTFIGALCKVALKIAGRRLRRRCRAGSGKWRSKRWQCQHHNNNHRDAEENWPRRPAIQIQWRSAVRLEEAPLVGEEQQIVRWVRSWLTLESRRCCCLLCGFRQRGHFLWLT